ncbi:glycosyltransferase N-terminal domain-containing protein, partial [Klebsiella oxytoca]
ARRYGKVKQHLQRMFSQISLIAPQDNTSGKRYLALGYEKDRLQLTGNIKYDLVVSDDLLKKIALLSADWVKNRPVWIAAST